MAPSKRSGIRQTVVSMTVFCACKCGKYAIRGLPNCTSPLYLRDLWTGMRNQVGLAMFKRDTTTFNAGGSTKRVCGSGILGYVLQAVQEVRDGMV